MDKEGLQNQRTGQIEMAGAMLLAGSSVPVGKMLTGSYSVFFIGSATMVFTIAVLLPFQFFRKWEILKLDRREWLPMVLQALFGIFLFRLFTLLGLRYTTGFFAGIVTSTSPLFFALFAFLIFHDRLTGRTVTALFLAFAGILWMNLQSGGEVGSGRNPFIGLAFMVLAVISEVFLTVFRKGSSGKVSSITNTLGLAFIALFFFSLPLFTGSRIPVLSSIPIQDWAILFYYGGVATALAYILWGDGALRISALQTGMITLCMPLSATGLSLFLLGERPGAGTLLGALLVIGGLGLSLLPEGKISRPAAFRSEPAPASSAERHVSPADPKADGGSESGYRSSDSL